MPIVQARVSEKEMYDMKAMAKSKGLTLSDVVRESVALYIANEKPTLAYGDMKDKIWMADDFDELPEGFEDYV